MAFAALGSDKIWQSWAFVHALCSYPLWLLLAGLISWVLVKFGGNLSAVVLNASFTLLMPAELVARISLSRQSVLWQEVGT